ncbi:MAG: hypothetical protein LUQ09_04385 [Methanomassiliicoccales archaeon]|nr:hypothetical protein [Methanomassiliicoccales archaeon]
MTDGGAKLNCEGCETSTFSTDTMIVDGQLVHIPGLEGIMEAVRKMKVPKRRSVADELLARVKALGVVPVGLEGRYRSALMDEYDRRYLTIM